MAWEKFAEIARENMRDLHNYLTFSYNAIISQYAISYNFIEPFKKLLVNNQINV